MIACVAMKDHAGPTVAAEQLAHDLGGDVAFLLARQGVYYARRERGDAFSPVLRLLRGIHELEPQRARWIVRNTVFSTVPPTASCAGAVKVAGRRLQALVSPVDHGRGEGPAVLIDAGRAVPAPRRTSVPLEAALRRLVDAGRHPRDEAGLVDLASRLARAVTSLAPAGVRWDRPVAALLADAKGNVLEWTTNTGSSNVTGHAELNLLEMVAARWGSLPPGSLVVSSLKPCKMCAGALWDFAGDRQALRVLFAENDPGRCARETVLEPGTMARRTFSRGTDVGLVPQRQHPSA